MRNTNFTTGNKREVESIGTNSLLPPVGNVQDADTTKTLPRCTSITSTHLPNYSNSIFVPAPTDQKRNVKRKRKSVFYSVRTATRKNTIQTENAGFPFNSEPEIGRRLPFLLPPQSRIDLPAFSSLLGLLGDGGARLTLTLPYTLRAPRVHQQ